MSLVYLTAVVFWTVIPSFQFGYHTAALNQLQATLSCQTAEPTTGSLSLPTCIPMSDVQFGILTSLFTAGGLLGSMMAGFLDRFGRKGACVTSAAFVVAGAALMSLAPSYPLLLIGRLATGIASGIALCVVPVMLSEIAPPAYKGTLATLNQMGVVIGVLVTQCAGLGLATPSLWRLVLVISGVISALQLAFSPFIYDTPPWLQDKGKVAKAEAAARLLWGVPDPTIADEDGDTEQPLLQDGSDELSQEESPPPTLSVMELFKSKELRTCIWVTIWCFVAQQGSGINAVMYYSSNILAKVLPELAQYISVIIAIINAIMTFPPIFLIEKLGRKPILLSSIVGAAASALLVAIGLNIGQPIAAGVGIVLFVGAFAAGLGPIPFVVTAQIAPFHAVSSLSSLALSVQWILNFFVAVTFLPLRDVLSFGRGLEGNIFALFTGVLILSGIFLSRLYHETP